MGTRKVSRNAQRLLTVREILHARDGVHSDGGGLYLRIAGNSAVWFLRYTSASGKRREMGLGAAVRRDAESASASVTTAREDADAARKVLAAGQDPIDARGAAEGAKRTVIAAKKAESKAAKLTLARAARAYHEKFVEPHRTEKHAFAWLSSLERNVPEALWHRPIAEVTAGDPQRKAAGLARLSVTQAGPPADEPRPLYKLQSVPRWDA
jgi:hypothetical protein